MAEAYKAQAQIQRLTFERDLFRQALEHIVGCDYRGNEPHEQRLARAALELADAHNTGQSQETERQS